MKIVMSSRLVERELRRRGWWDAAQALRASRDNWFVQDCNEFIMCRGGHLSFYKVAFSDCPISIYLLKGVLAGLEDVSDLDLTLPSNAPTRTPRQSRRGTS